MHILFFGNTFSISELTSKKFEIADGKTPTTPNNLFQVSPLLIRTYKLPKFSKWRRASKQRHTTRGEPQPFQEEELGV